MVSLLNFLANNPWFYPLLVVIYYIFWPGTMFAVTAVFESRTVYLGRGQSRMFFPGDFMLGIAAVNFLAMHVRNPLRFEKLDVCNPLYWLVTGVIFAILAFGIRQLDIARYPIGAARCPSKLAHDICGFYFCFWWIAALGIPQIIDTIQRRSFAPCEKQWVIFALVAVVFIAMTIVDLAQPVTLEVLLLRHPVDYEPIWKTHHIARTGKSK